MYTELYLNGKYQLLYEALFAAFIISILFHIRSYISFQTVP